MIRKPPISRLTGLRALGRRILTFTGSYVRESWERERADLVQLKDVVCEDGRRFSLVWVYSQNEFKTLGARPGDRFGFEASWYRYLRGDNTGKWGLVIAGNVWRVVE